VLNFVEESFDEIALTIKCVIAVARLLPVGSGWNHRGDAALFESIDERIGIKRFVADQSVGVGIFEQRFCAGQIVILSRCQY